MENEVTRLGIKIVGRKSKVNMVEGIWQAWQEARKNIREEEKKNEAEKRKRDAAVELEEARPEGKSCSWGEASREGKASRHGPGPYFEGWGPREWHGSSKR